MKIHNTLTKKIEKIEPMERGKIKMYTCGPTVYNYIHLGNARMTVFFDVMRRFFQHEGYQVNFVQNITDVDDRIINQARVEGLRETDISEKYLAEFNKDLESLNVIKPTVQPKVTEHIDDIIQFIEKLMEKGLAYRNAEGVWYDVRKFSEYGKLTNHSIEQSISGEKDGYEKRSEADFALWKSKKENEISWDSPFGKGRPGWHIECSAMSMRYLGETFDIHGGGLDLCFPHHVNEMAQSEGLTGKPMANYWVHNNFVTVDGQKMSKSLGNFTTLRDALSEYDANTIRWFFLSVNYENEMDYSETAMKQAEINVKKIDNLLNSLEHLRKIGKKKTSESDAAQTLGDYFTRQVEKHLRENMSTALALDALLSFVKETNKSIEQGTIDALGAEKIIKTLDTIYEILGFVRVPQKETGMEKQEILRWIQERDVLKIQAKKALTKEEKIALFKKTDEIRNQLKSQGVLLEDTTEGTRYKII